MQQKWVQEGSEFLWFYQFLRSLLIDNSFKKLTNLFKTFSLDRGWGWCPLLDFVVNVLHDPVVLKVLNGAVQVRVVRVCIGILAGVKGRVAERSSGTPKSAWNNWCFSVTIGRIRMMSLHSGKKILMTLTHNSHSTTPLPMNRARKWYTFVTLLYDLALAILNHYLSPIK